MTQTKYPWYWTRSQHERWRVRREKGIVHFFCTYAAPWGGFMFLGMAVIPYLIHTYNGQYDALSRFAVTSLICFAMTFLYGILCWRYYEKYFRRYSHLDR